MAVVWEKSTRERVYRVTQAGSSVRLYTNGVFHSQYNPRQPVAGNVWDLLFLPAFMHPEPQGLGNVLVLGVGGGAVIRQLNQFLQPQRITGVDLDPVHLHVAERYFGAAQGNVQLIAAEARTWLQAYQGPAFDLIVEDLFSDALSPAGVADPVRAIAADVSWLRLLNRHLSDKGVLVMNFESGRSLRNSAWAKRERASAKIASAYQFGCSRYENAIGAFVRKPLPAGQFLRNLRCHPLLDQRRKSCRLEFSYRKLWSRLK